MKKILLFAAVVAALVACKKDEPKQVHAVTFHVHGLVVETEPMNGPRKATTPPLTDEEGNQMTDLIIWDGTTYLTRQQNTDPNFGTITVMLTTGEHHLHFIATRSTELVYSDGVLHCESLRQTFGAHYDIDVTGGSDENVSLARITGLVEIKVEDEVPTGAANLNVHLSDYYKGIDPTTFNAVRSGEFDANINLAGMVGTSNNQWTLNILVPEYQIAKDITYTLTATNTSSDVIGQATGIMATNSNTKTKLHGNLFTGTRSFVSLNTSWNADINAPF